jgi:Methyltransferase FkbM domain
MKGSTKQQGARLQYVFLFGLVGCAMLSFLSSPTRTLSSTDDEAFSFLPQNLAPSFTSSARHCNSTKMNPILLKSQGGEDKFVLQWFNGLCRGTYLEMGAVDGISFSNTYALHKALDWKGLLIEMSPPSYKELVINRPDDVTVNAGICDTPRTLHYWYDPNRRYTASIWEFTAPTFRARYWQGVRLEDTTPITCVPLDQIIKGTYASSVRNENTPNKQLVSSHFFDFYSLDVEGGELMVLKSIDFTTTGFGIIVVEADSTNERKNLALRMYLESKGYRFLQQVQRNYWFVNQNFAEIYADVLMQA